MAEVRYIVEDVGASVDFYETHLGFACAQRYGPAMAVLERGDLKLWVAGPPASASKPMPDGAKPEPGGGWARVVLTVDDLPGLVVRLKEAGVSFRNEILDGPGGKQVLCLDPSGNLIELFEPA